MTDSNCIPLTGFMKYLDEHREDSIELIEQKARATFPDDEVENRKNSFVLINFKTSLPCLELTKNWPAPVIGAPPSPPALDANHGPLKFKSIEENPYHWSSRTYQQFGRTIVMKNDRERIKSLRIDKI